MKDVHECAVNCDGTARLTERETGFFVKGVAVSVLQEFYKCDKCGVEYTTTELDDRTLERLREKERELGL